MSAKAVASPKAVAPAGKVAHVSASLASWSVHEPAIRTDVTATAALTADGWWIVDPVPIRSATLKRLLGDRMVIGILLTNENHERSAHALAGSLRVQVHAHEATRGRMEREPDHFFRDGTTLRGGLRVVHLPGASKGESAFVDDGNRAILVGDSLINLKETGFTFLPDKYCENPSQMKKSLGRLLDFEFSVLTFAHGPPLASKAKQRLQELLRTA